MRVVSLFGLFSYAQCYSYLPVAHGLLDIDDHYYIVKPDPFLEKIRRLLQLAKRLQTLNDEPKPLIMNMPLNWG